MEANTYKRMNAQGITIFTADELRMGEMANAVGKMSFSATYSEAMIGSELKAKLPGVTIKGAGKSTDDVVV